MQAKTKAKTDVLLSQKGDYRAPEQLTVELNAKRRQDKADMEEERRQLTKQYRYDLPKASN